MAQHNIEEEKLNKGLSEKEYRYPIRETDVMTGGNDYKKYLYYQLKTSILRANKIDIIVSFLMETGVRLLIDDLKVAISKGIKIRLLTGNYLGITQPGALYLIKRELGDQVDLRFYNDSSRSFHPKSYIFYGDIENEIYIGSSNLSRSALTSGIEWNYRFTEHGDRENFNLFADTFRDLFNNHSIKIDDDELARYAKNWRRPKVQQDLDRYDSFQADNDPIDIFEPRGYKLKLFMP